MGVGPFHHQRLLFCSSSVLFCVGYGGGSSSNPAGDAMTTRDEKGNALIRVKRLPLTLIEEVPPPERVLTDLELVMMAWCEEHARQYAIVMMAIRVGIFVLLLIILYVFYRTQLSSERMIRGVAHMPADLRIGSVVYFDVAENGADIGRVVIGLLNENCPLYCEYFHRRCTGSGETGDSFRGMQLAAIVPRHCLIFGDGREMTHDVTGFNPHYLPTEHLGTGSWRGALSSIAYGVNKESPNFAIHVSAGDYAPQIFALVIGGFDVIERINAAGSKHGNAPKKEFTIVECGELCTLAKSHILPMPWKLYEGISRGYDEEKFGERLPREFLERSDGRSAARALDSAAGEEVVGKTAAWWRFLW
ncbi:putative cyclophilin [Trypanosoma rangeli]|uniref:Putative cyclophilin n=1 Tax=Trypanosoma rangeli TaxID=5698 RepID=A0A422NQ98_TRYRA|nr:putative cyclophilin [Trypanosoma rangeli]RNF07652.1 putative cyclophilin [Trypanosoma rangeli]|eukprot:RNF07652.1 putative cyclophilin [Trypanosoma rangeli]